MSAEVQHLHVTYNHIHNLIQKVTPEIATEFNPDLLIAIGGGGFFPARVLVRVFQRLMLVIARFDGRNPQRTFLRKETENKSLQIQAIGLSLYEPLPGTTVEQIGREVVRTQWLGPDSGKLLLGKRNLIVDEVDDTRTTLHYALSELQKDVENELLSHPESEREKLRSATKFAAFVLHNKKKDKQADLPSGTPYYAGAEVGPVWLEYPWEATNIEEHDYLALLDSRSSCS